MSGVPCIDPCVPCPTPPPPVPGPGAPPPPPPPPTSGSIGPDGVLKIYPDNTAGTQFYLNMASPYTGSASYGNSPDAQFNISYGTNSQFPFTKKTKVTSDDPLIYFNTTGSPISYNSGQPPSRSVRMDIYPAGGKFANNFPYYWKSNPGYLYKPNGIRSGEHTVFVRPNAPKVGVHASCAHKVGGRDDDTIRSLIEICEADAEHSSPFGNWNYIHFPYYSCPITITASFVKMTPGKWIGTKSVKRVAADRSFETLELWQDPAPFKSDGTPANNWRKIAVINDHGVSGYDNIPCTWACHKDVMRIDGYASVDFTLLSDREIIPTATPSAAAAAVTTPYSAPKLLSTTTGLSDDYYEGTLDFSGEVTP